MVTALEHPQSLGKNYAKCKHNTIDDSTPYTYTILVYIGRKRARILFKIN